MSRRLRRSRVGGQLLAHLETWRLYTLAYVGLVSLAGAALADPDAEVWRLVGAWAVPTLGWLAGLYVGDYLDRRLDAVAKPHRPIPSGRMPAAAGIGGFVVCTAAGALIGVVLNWRTAILVAVALAGGVSYNAFFKARGLSGNAVRGALTAFAFLFGAMATAHYPPLILLPLALVFWMHDAGSNIIGTLRDIVGDRAGGYATYAVRNGARAALRVAAVCWLAWVALGGAAVAGSPRAGAATVVLFTVAACAGLAALGVVARVADSPPAETALRAHEILVIERVILAVAFVALGLGGWTAAAIGVPALAMTVVAQWTTRYRYEFGSADAVSRKPPTIVAQPAMNNRGVAG